MNKSIKALIIDDEAKSRNALKWMIEHYCPNIEIMALAASVEEGIRCVQSYRPNLLFLDVEMPYGSGFDLLKQLPSIDFEVIFVTGFDQYALQAIKYHALDYLLKPLDKEELLGAVRKVEIQLSKKIDSERLEKLLTNLQHTNHGLRQIAIAQNGGRTFIPVEQIVYCMADGACTWFVMANGQKLLSSKNLGEYEKVLPAPADQFQNHFFRIHYRYTINLSYIQQFNWREKYVELKNGTRIAVAQRRVGQFKDLLQAMNLL